MRIVQKKQAEAFVKLLGQVHEEIKKAVEKKNTATALSLLADCQEGAISLGNLIETTEGENAPTIPLLESYCEILFRIHTQLSCADAQEKPAYLSESKIYKLLRQFYLKIESSVKNDIKVRLEVVFLPYKASMWDSLESVWKAAEEAEDCDAYVIPIPYYDRNPDGSFGEMHYEADQYPANVPVIGYQEYDFEKRLPDMIFIHNPYDEYNFVTSVAPFFYSKNLKKYTEKLVYIPYFILPEVKADDLRALEGMEKFCLLPGVLNADQVIVQSEEMRQVYLTLLTEKSGQRTRGYWEQKILGLGSPKLDRVKNTGKKELEIPEEWKKIICKPDGSWKKIVFYNTSVTALLNENEQMLEKIRDVFRIFYESREEVALLWRPHPLIRATIESMRPRLWRAYKEIVDTFRQEGWGIYDDTADIDRAVVLSDAYYGDYSSVVQLYQETGKPIMHQECNQIHMSGNHKWQPEFTRSFYSGEELYFSSANYNGFFSADLTTGKVVMLGNFAGERMDGCTLSSNFLQRGDEIVICPCNAKNTYVYQIGKKSISPLNIDKIKGQSFLMYQISEGAKDGYCLVPSFGKLFGKINKNLTALEYGIDFKDKYKKETGTEYRACSDSGIYLYNGVVYFAAMEQNLLVKVKPDTHSMDFLRIPNVQGGFYKILGKGKYLYMLTRENEIIKYDLETEKGNTFIKSEELSREKDIFRDGFCQNGHIYFVSYFSDKCIKIKDTTEEVMLTTLEEEWTIHAEPGETYRFTHVQEDKWLFVVSDRNHLIRIDLSGGKHEKVTLEFDVERIKAALDREIRKCISDGVLIQERGNLYDLKDLFELAGDGVKADTFGTEQMVGSAVFKTVQGYSINAKTI